jgi:hypothetical protein
MLQKYVSSVLDVSSRCCKCFMWNVAKVDWDVAYVVMVVHVGCKLLFPMFQLFFRTYVASVFIWMLHMFHTYVAHMFIWMLHIFCNGFFKRFLGVSTSVSDVCYKCLTIFRYLLQNVSFRCFKSRSGVASPSLPSAVSPQCLLLFSMLVMLRRHGWGESFERCRIRTSGACGTEQRQGVGSGIRTQA